MIGGDRELTQTHPQENEIRTITVQFQEIQALIWQHSRRQYGTAAAEFRGGAEHFHDARPRWQLCVRQMGWRLGAAAATPPQDQLALGTR